MLGGSGAESRLLTTDDGVRLHLLHWPSERSPGTPDSSMAVHTPSIAGPATSIGFPTVASRVLAGSAALEDGVLAFPDAGSFAYHCNLHIGMNGTIVVH